MQRQEGRVEGWEQPSAEIPWKIGKCSLREIRIPPNAPRAQFQGVRYVIAALCIRRDCSCFISKKPDPSAYFQLVDLPTAVRTMCGSNEAATPAIASTLLPCGACMGLLPVSMHGKYARVCLRRAQRNTEIKTDCLLALLMYLQ